MANTFRKVYKKTGNSGTSSDYQLVGNIGVNGIELDIMKGATSSVDGQIGLVPKPTKGQENYLLQGNSVWVSPDSVINNSSITDKIFHYSEYVIHNRMILDGSADIYFRRINNICVIYFYGVFTIPQKNVLHTIINNADIPVDYLPKGGGSSPDSPGVVFFNSLAVNGANLLGYERLSLFNNGKLLISSTYQGNAEHHFNDAYIV